MVKDHSDSERRNPLPPHGLLFPINIVITVIIGVVLIVVEIVVVVVVTGRSNYNV